MRKLYHFHRFEYEILLLLFHFIDEGLGDGKYVLCIRTLYEYCLEYQVPLIRSIKLVLMTLHLSH